MGGARMVWVWLSLWPKSLVGKTLWCVFVAITRDSYLASGCNTEKRSAIVEQSLIPSLPKPLALTSKVLFYISNWIYKCTNRTIVTWLSTTHGISSIQVSHLANKCKSGLRLFCGAVQELATFHSNIPTVLLRYATLGIHVLVCSQSTTWVLFVHVMNACSSGALTEPTIMVRV